MKHQGISDNVLPSIEDDDADGENANANNHEHEDDPIEEHEDGEEHYEWNIDWVSISWLALFFYDFYRMFCQELNTCSCFGALNIANIHV